MTSTRSSHPTARRALSALAALALATTGGVLGAAAAQAAPGDSPTSGLEYVALGDSYASGYGIDPIPGGIGCGRSDDSYPNLLAEGLDLDLTDVTCSGATTAHIIDTMHTTDVGTNPVQSSALSESTDIVTLTIGGNDLGFADIAATCAATAADGPTLLTTLGVDNLQNCKERYFPAGGIDSLSELIDSEVADGLDDALATIHDKAPNARVFVIGYPALTPDAAHTPSGDDGCFTPVGDLSTYTLYDRETYPLQPVDVEYLNGTQAHLDHKMGEVTAAAGDTYVSLFADTLGLTACAESPDAVVRGITGSLTGGVEVGTLGGVIPVYVAHGALHPNADGAARMANAAQAAIEAAVTAPTITSAAPAGGTVGDSYTFSVTASGFPTAISYAVADGDSLPPGLTLSAAGEISGTPTAGGEYTFAVTATNTAGGTTSLPYTITINEAPTVTAGVPPQAEAGMPYSFTLSATGYPAPTFAVVTGTLPDGLNLNEATGEISGTPTAGGDATVTIRVDNAASTAEVVITLSVAPASTGTTPGDTTPPGGDTTPPGDTTPADTTPGDATPADGLAATGTNDPAPVAALAAFALLLGAALITAHRMRRRTQA